MLWPDSYFLLRSAASLSRSPPVTRLPFLSSTTRCPPLGNVRFSASSPQVVRAIALALPGLSPRERGNGRNGGADGGTAKISRRTTAVGAGTPRPCRAVRALRQAAPSRPAPATG